MSLLIHKKPCHLLNFKKMCVKKEKTEKRKNRKVTSAAVFTLRKQKLCP
jgi:hypothetical protein